VFSVRYEPNVYTKRTLNSVFKEFYMMLSDDTAVLPMTDRISSLIVFLYVGIFSTFIRLVKVTLTRTSCQFLVFSLQGHRSFKCSNTAIACSILSRRMDSNLQATCITGKDFATSLSQGVLSNACKFQNLESLSHIVLWHHISGSCSLGHQRERENVC
jgi:hypothetical protein